VRVRNVQYPLPPGLLRGARNVLGHGLLVQGLLSSTRGTRPAIDRIKSYTSLLRDLKKVPVFTEFCEFERLLYVKPKRIPAEVPAEVSCDPCPSYDAFDTLSQCSDPNDTLLQQLQFVKDPLQPSAEEALAQLVRHAGGGGVIDWREVSDKSLAGAIASWRQRGLAEAEIKRMLTVDMQQPSDRVELAMFSERDRYSLYLVGLTLPFSPDDPKHLILDQPFCLVTFDTWLLCRDWEGCITRGVIKPFNLAVTKVEGAIKALWSSSLHVDLKKFLPNKHVGICGRSENRRSNTLLFQSAAEARSYAARMEGATILSQLLGKNTYHFVTQEWRTPLSEGFMPIHHAVLDAQRRVLYKKAIEVGQPVLAVKTDCLFFKGHDPALDVPKRGNYGSIGTWCVEKAKEWPTNSHRMREWLPEWLPSLNNTPKVQHLSVVDEYDATAFAALFSSHNHVLVLADIPGAGKTYALKSFLAPLGPAGLFVTPWNALADDLVKGGAFDAITFNRLLGLLAHGEEAEEDEGEGKSTKTRGHDISAISHIVFDEIFCLAPPQLGQLKRFMERNASMEDGTPRMFFAAGDANQNMPIFPSCLPTLELKDYYIRAISTLFPNQIRLRVCKRVTGAEQQQRIFLIKEEVLSSTTPLLDICRKYFKPINKLSQVRGRAVAYTNEVARCVNNFREERLAKALESGGQEVFKVEGRLHYLGQTLRCRKFNKSPRLYVNYTYTVSGIERLPGGEVTIQLEETGEFAWTPLKLKHHMIYDGAATCHSLQGLTAEDGITLFEVGLWCASRAWFYTALTRARNLSEIYFWDGDDVSGLAPVLRHDFKAILEAKLPHYALQDKAAGRPWDEGDFIDGDHVMALYDSQNGQCVFCLEWFPARWQPRDSNQVTVDRLDNSLAHVKGNCVLSCLRCNSTRH
jgi:hypothetical protein